MLGHQTRRGFMCRVAAGMPLVMSHRVWASGKHAEDKPPMRVAAVVTEHTYRSHAHVILANFLEPYLFNGRLVQPGMKVVALYVDQTPVRDLSRELSRKYGIPIYPTIQQALCCGGDRLSVDAVLSIGEHGKYPVNWKAQMEYPRKRFFDEIVEVFRRSGRVVPVFSDKHLSFRWDWAKEMYDAAQSMGFGLMAGSSVPLAQRTPELELPRGVRLEEAVSIHGGGVESYDIHGLEVLQSMVESRRGGETGVEWVQFLEGDALWAAAKEGLWSVELAVAALACKPIPGLADAKELVRPEPLSRGGRPFITHGILVRYKDGTRGTMLAAGITGTNWHFGCQVKGEKKPRATTFYVGPWQNRNLFKALSHAIQTHFREGRSPYPVERTLLTTGILDAAMDSRVKRGSREKTPHLEFGYEARDYRRMREMGGSWKILTEARVEPLGLEYGGS